jgi:hypothetical protein
MPFVAGELIEATFDSKTGHFVASYWASPNGESELFLSKDRTYKNGYEMIILPKEQLSLEENGNYHKIKYLGQQKKKISISIHKL